MTKMEDKRGTIEKLIDGFRAWQYKRIRDKCEDRKNLKLRVRASKHKLYSDYVYPRIEKRAWDYDTYFNGNIFRVGKSNPIDIDDTKSNRKLIPSQKYRAYMQNKLVDDIMSSGRKTSISGVLMALLITNMISFGAVLFLILMMLGVI